MSKPIIQVRLVGGFGNQLFQYACAKKYALLHDAVLEAPDWVGRKLFGLHDPYWSSDQLPQVNDGGSGRDGIQPGQVNVSLGGYFQFQHWMNILSKSELRKWFRFQPQYRMPKKYPYYISAHVRQGDYINHPLYCNVTEESYVAACRQYNLDINKVVWVRQDTPERIPQWDAEGLWFLADFLTLMQSDVLLRANSTFSWWASVLGDCKTYSPVVENLIGLNTVPFVEGNWPRCSDTSRVGVTTTDLHLPD